MAARSMRGPTQTAMSGGSRANPCRRACSGVQQQRVRRTRCTPLLTALGHRGPLMATETPLDLITGAFSYSGSHIAQRLLNDGHRVRTLTFHPGRPHRLQGRIEAFSYDFDDANVLERSFAGVGTFYNTYWVR